MPTLASIRNSSSQFANQRLLRAFALLHLAARELPFERVAAALAALANQYSPVA